MCEVDWVIDINRSEECGKKYETEEENCADAKGEYVRTSLRASGNTGKENDDRENDDAETFGECRHYSGEY